MKKKALKLNEKKNVETEWKKSVEIE